jgi:molybdate transport system ATP-binding protein
MSAGLVARFELRYSRGATIVADLEQPADGFGVTVLFGPSGCGKTTLLRCLAGLEAPQSGFITFGGETWFDAARGIHRSPQERGIGFLFQEYALFPHLTVVENIAYGLRDLPPPQRRERIVEMRDRLQLEGLDDRYPHQISGGQQQRVALARALARRPRLLLLDEPLSALDGTLREELRGQLRRILSRFDVPVIVVTHDRVEAIALGDRIAVMQGGRIRQSGDLAAVFAHPVDADIARIIGVETILEGRITSVNDGLATVQIGAATLIGVAPPGDTEHVHVCIKGEDVTLQHGHRDHISVRNQLPATVKWMSPEGPLVRVGLDCGFELTSLITRPACEELQLATGTPVTALIKAPSIHLVPRPSTHP